MPIWHTTHRALAAHDDGGHVLDLGGYGNFCFCGHLPGLVVHLGLPHPHHDARLGLSCVPASHHRAVWWKSSECGSQDRTYRPCQWSDGGACIGGRAGNGLQPCFPCALVLCVSSYDTKASKRQSTTGCVYIDWSQWLYLCRVR